MNLRMTFTKAEIEEARDDWRWLPFCRYWGFIGAAYAELCNQEQALWRGWLL